MLGLYLDSLIIGHSILAYKISIGLLNELTLAYKTELQNICKMLFWTKI